MIHPSMQSGLHRENLAIFKLELVPEVSDDIVHDFGLWKLYVMETSTRLIMSVIHNLLLSLNTQLDSCSSSWELETLKCPNSVSAWFLKFWYWCSARSGNHRRFFYPNNTCQCYTWLRISWKYTYATRGSHTLTLTQVEEAKPPTRPHPQRPFESEEALNVHNHWREDENWRIQMAPETPKTFSREERPHTHPNSRVQSREHPLPWEKKLSLSPTQVQVGVWKMQWDVSVEK